MVTGSPALVRSSDRRTSSASASSSPSSAKVARSTATTTETRLSTMTLPLRSRMRPRGACSWTMRIRLASAACWNSGAAATWRNQRRAKSATNSDTATMPRIPSRTCDVGSLIDHSTYEQPSASEGAARCGPSGRGAERTVPSSITPRTSNRAPARARHVAARAAGERNERFPHRSLHVRATERQRGRGTLRPERPGSGTNGSLIGVFWSSGQQSGRRSLLWERPVHRTKHDR